MLPELVERFCVGHGIEVGPGPHPLCKGAVSLDRFTGNPAASPAPNIVADAAKIPVCDGEFDFLLSSHMLEHHQNTLRVLYEWKRIIKPGGIMFLMLPHHARTFDKFRAVTTLQHHIDDFANLGDQDDYSHFDEIKEGWSKVEISEQEITQFEADWRIGRWDWPGRLRNGLVHFHVWSQNELVDLFRYVGLSIEYVVDLVPERPDSFLVVGRLTERHLSRDGITSLPPPDQAS